jgi:translocation and assembly module TamA
LTALYSIPLRDPSRERLEFLASRLTEDTSTVDSRTSILGVRRIKVRADKWLETLYLNAQQESFRVGADSGHSTLLLPGINWTRTRKRAGAYLQSGDRLFFEVKGSDAWLGSDTRFMQVVGKGKLIKALNKKSRVLLRLDLGVSEVGSFSELPASQRFFAGGDQSVRGYDYNSLGPEDETGDVIGGRYLMVGSLEYERQILDKWSVALFYDVGNAMDVLTDPLMHGAGIGVRWQTPIGPVRIDIASALDKADRPLRLHLFFGPDL